MSWEPHQQYRLAMEKRILRERMPDFLFFSPTSDTFVSGTFDSSHLNRYRIVVELPPGFPDECPSCFIADPCPLLGHDDVCMTSFGNSHQMHTWLTDDRHPEWTRICTYKPASWSASHSLEKVVQKAELGLEAFEAHRVTGRPIADFLLNM